MTIWLGMTHDAMRELPRKLQLRRADEAKGGEDNSSDEGRSCWSKFDLMGPSSTPKGTIATRVESIR